MEHMIVGCERMHTDQKNLQVLGHVGHFLNLMVDMMVERYDFT